MRKTMILGAGLVLCLSSTAFADDYDKPAYSEDGVGLFAGGGVAGFTDKDMRDFATEAPAWQARLSYGTHSKLFTVEAAYLGSVQAIDALGLDTSAQLVSTGVEGLVRMNLIQGRYQPYVLAGIGWTRYDVTNAKTNTSDVNDSDNVGNIPFGVGFAMRFDQMLIDARAEYRPAFDNNLIQATENSKATLDSWAATANIGYEF